MQNWVNSIMLSGLVLAGTTACQTTESAQDPLDDPGYEEPGYEEAYDEFTGVQVDGIEDIMLKYDGNPRLAIRDARVYLHIGKTDIAIAILERVTAEGKWEKKRLFHLARGYAKLGDYSQAIELNEEVEMADERELAAVYNSACYSALDEAEDETIQGYLDRLAIKLEQRPERTHHYHRMLQSDSDFEAVREADWFQTYVARFSGDDSGEYEYDSEYEPGYESNAGYETEPSYEYEPESEYEPDYDNSNDYNSEEEDPSAYDYGDLSS